MLRLVCDTNIYISAYQFGGVAREVLRFILNNDCAVFVSPAILKEIERTLDQKFNWPEAKIVALIENITSFTELVRPTKKLRVVTADSDDNRILECALAAKAEIIVSGDSDLLDLGSYKNIKIMSMRDFLNQQSLKKAA